MDIRQLNKRIQIYQSSTASNGFAGNDKTFNLIGESWANIKTVNAQSQNAINTEFGMLNATSSIIVTTRKRNDLTYNTRNMYIMYRGVKYIIKSFATNVNFEDRLIQFVCVRENG